MPDKVILEELHALDVVEQKVQKGDARLFHAFKSNYGVVLGIEHPCHLLTLPYVLLLIEEPIQSLAGGDVEQDKRHEHVGKLVTELAVEHRVVEVSV